MPTKPKQFGALTKQESQRRDYERRGSCRDKGYDWRWEKYSAWFRRQPENVICACGCGRMSNQERFDVDHIDAVSGPSDPGFWDMANHQALASDCHRKKSIRFDGWFGRNPDTSEQGKRDLQAMRDAARERAERIDARSAGRFNA